MERRRAFCSIVSHFSDSVHLDVESRRSADFVGSNLWPIVGCRGSGLPGSPGVLLPGDLASFGRIPHIFYVKLLALFAPGLWTLFPRACIWRRTNPPYLRQSTAAPSQLGKFSPGNLDIISTSSSYSGFNVFSAACCCIFRTPPVGVVSRLSTDFFEPSMPNKCWSSRAPGCRGRPEFYSQVTRHRVFCCILRPCSGPVQSDVAYTI